jgi:hypothetical protein
MLGGGAAIPTITNDRTDHSSTRREPRPEQGQDIDDANVVKKLGSCESGDSERDDRDNEARFPSHVRLIPPAA